MKVGLPAQYPVELEQVSDKCLPLMLVIAWEDGRPAESGLPRNVKNNMFRLI